MLAEEGVMLRPVNDVSAARHGKLGGLQLGRKTEKWKCVDQLCSSHCKYLRAKPRNCGTGSG